MLARYKILIFSIFLSANVIYGQDTLIYENGLDFLRLGVGVRACGMGEAFVAVANDASAHFWNPAGLGSLSKLTVMFTHAEWLFETRFEGINSAMPFKFGTFAPYFMYLSSGQIEETDEFGRETGTYENYDLAAGIGYGIQPEQGLHFGFGAKFFQEKLQNYSASGISLGIGVLYRSPIGISFGLSGMNIGKGTKFIDVRNNQPLIIRFGIAYQGSIQPINIIPALDFVYDRTFKINFGGEIMMLNVLTLRGGYRIGLRQQCFTIGSGISVPVQSRKIYIDYALTGLAELGGGHRFSLAFDF